MTLDAKALDAHRFSQAQLDALYDAILIDDDVNARIDLPDAIRLDYDDAVLLDCFRLSRQLWKDGVQQGALVRLSRKLTRYGDLDEEDRQAYKHIRAKYKNLRFAFALFSVSHRYPTMFDAVTVSMGHVQDAMKSGRSYGILRRTLESRFLLGALPQAMMRREVDRFDPDSGAGFRAYVENQVAKLRRTVARKAVTAAEFHETRKIISRQGAFYNSLGVIQPSAEVSAMSQSMAAINGLMGRMHDDLIAAKIAGTQDYHRELFVLPDAIHTRLETLLAHYPPSCGR